MDFKDKVQTLADRFIDLLEKIKDPKPSEAHTKDYFVKPFIEMLGYETRDPDDVKPEFTADIGTKKGEKVDYAIMQAGNPVVLIECKRKGVDLSNTSAIDQLYRYLRTQDETRIGVLADGIEYRFFSDIDMLKMRDRKPFFTFNMLDFSHHDVQKLEGFTKSKFDLDEILETAKGKAKRAIADLNFVCKYIRSRYGPADELSIKQIRKFRIEGSKECARQHGVKSGLPPITKNIKSALGGAYPDLDTRLALYMAVYYN